MITKKLHYFKKNTFFYRNSELNLYFFSLNKIAGKFINSLNINDILE